MGYRDRSGLDYEMKIKNGLEDMPWYCGEFCKESKDRFSISTLFIYLWDLRGFLESRLDDSPTGKLKDVPLLIFQKMTEDEARAYLDSLTVKDPDTGIDQPISLSYRKHRIASFRAFFRYLIRTKLADHDPFGNIPMLAPPVRKTSLLTESAISGLISGIRKNDLYLCRETLPDGSVHEYIGAISPSVKLRRERQITRNIAIITLMIYTGLSVADIVSLDLENIDYENGCIRYEKSGTKTFSVPYNDAVLSALSDYLHGGEVPEELLNRQISPDRNEFLTFCIRHMTDPNADRKAARQFKNSDPHFLEDVRLCTSHLRKQGRQSFFPHPDDHALFLSNRSRRISIRMIQDMVLELTRTYLPGSDGKTGLSPSFFRSAVTGSLASEPGGKEQLKQIYGYNPMYISNIVQKRNADPS